MALDNLYSCLLQMLVLCRSIPKAKDLRQVSADDAAPIADAPAAATAARAPLLSREQVATQAAGAPLHAHEEGMVEGADVEAVEKQSENEIELEEMVEAYHDDLADVEYGHFSDAILEAESWYPIDDVAFWANPTPPLQAQDAVAPLVGSHSDDFDLEDYPGV